MILKVKKLLLHRIDELNYQDLSRSPIITSITKAGIAQLVEHNLAKVGVASSSLVSRSKIWAFSWQYGEIQYVS